MSKFYLNIWIWTAKVKWKILSNKLILIVTISHLSAHFQKSHWFSHTSNAFHRTLVVSKLCSSFLFFTGYLKPKKPFSCPTAAHWASQPVHLLRQILIRGVWILSLYACQKLPETAACITIVALNRCANEAQRAMHLTLVSKCTLYFYLFSMRDSSKLKSEDFLLQKTSWSLKMTQMSLFCTGWIVVQAAIINSNLHTGYKKKAL